MYSEYIFPVYIRMSLQIVKKYANVLLKHINNFSLSVMQVIMKHLSVSG